MSKVPAGWQYLTIGNIADTVMGFAFKSSDFVDTGIPLLRMGNLYQNGFDLKRNPVFLPEKFKDQYSKFIVKPGDLVMSMTGTMGKCDYGFTVKIPAGSKETLLNQRVLKFISKRNNNSEFLLNVLRSDLTLSLLYSFPGGTKQANLSAKQIQDLPVLVPPFPEQIKIAQILSTWDKVIATTEQLIANSQQQKKALMQGLLTGKKRLPGFKGELRLYSFSDVSRIDKDNLNNKTLGSFSFKYISLSDVKVGVIAEKLECFTFENAPSRARRIIKEGDILLATVRPNLQGFARIEKQHEDMIASTGFSVLSPKELFCSDYIYHYLFSDSLTSQIDSLVVGSNYPAINSSDVANLQILCPDYNEQIKIAEVLDNCANVIETLQKKLAFLKQEKTALMQQLLTGKRRVKVEAA